MLDSLKITILTENRVVNPNLIAEQGLCLHVATPEGNFLFDTGHTDAFLHNARQLGIDLSDISYIVLSHGHYDHVGGLYFYLKEFGSARVVCHPNIFHKKFRIVNGERLEIGFPYEMDDLIELGAQFIFKTNPFHLSENVMITGEIPRVTDYETIDEGYQERVLESFIHDELHDDMGMVIRTRKGLVVLLGCAHSGPVNTIKHGMRLLNTRQLYAVMGGMHLSGCPFEKIQKVVQGLESLKPGWVAPLHCTGFQAIMELYRHFHERTLLFNVGDTLTLDLPEPESVS